MSISFDKKIEEINIIFSELNYHLSTKTPKMATHEANPDFLLIKEYELFLAHALKFKSKMFHDYKENFFRHSRWVKEFENFDFLIFFNIDMLKPFGALRVRNFKIYSSETMCFLIDLVLKKNKQGLLYDFKLTYRCNTLTPAEREYFAKKRKPDYYIDLPKKKSVNCTKVPATIDNLTRNDKVGLNALVEDLRTYFGDSKHAKTILNKSSYYQIQKKYKDYCQNFDILLSQYSKLTCISFEFGLYSTCMEPLKVEEQVSLFEFKQKLINNGRKYEPFSKNVWNFGGWFYFPNRACITFRIILVYQTSSVGSIKALISDIESYWEDEITNGLGFSFKSHIASCDKFKKQYCRLAVTDSDLVDTFKKHVIGFIVKNEFYYQPTTLKQIFDARNEKNSKIKLTFRRNIDTSKENRDNKQ